VEQTVETIKFRFVGASPLLMHSDRSVDTLDEGTRALKKLTSIKKKTEEIERQIMRAEWELGLYFDAKLGPYLPTHNLRASLEEGARVNRLGMDVKKATVILTEREPLQYTGPRTIEGLWAGGVNHRDRRSVGQVGKRIMRTRPLFLDWSVSFELLFDSEVIQRDKLVTAAEIAGRLVGLGDYRPSCGGTFGRFNVEVSK
jgi:hypothetical protein